jgi:hypothetical protein
VGASKRHNRQHRRRPPPEFWIKLALTANFLAQLLPDQLALLVGVVVLALPAWWFRA